MKRFREINSLKFINSNRNYNVLFKDESGKEADAQITAFEDTWHWTQSAIEAVRGFI